MTFDERVEALQDELRNTLGIRTPSAATLARGLRICFPDLYGEKPTAWIAPWSMSQEQHVAGVEASDSDDGYGFFFDSVYSAMRDAHLKRG